MPCIAYLKNSGLRQHISFLGPCYHTDFNQFGTIMHPTDSARLCKDVLLGVFLQNTPTSSTGNTLFILYVVNWAKKQIFVFDPLGKCSYSLIAKIYHLVMVLSSRGGCQTRFSVFDLSDFQSFSVSFQDKGLALCGVGAKLLANSPTNDFEDEAALKQYVQLVLLNC